MQFRNQGPTEPNQSPVARWWHTKIVPGYERTLEQLYHDEYQRRVDAHNADPQNAQLAALVWPSVIDGPGGMDPTRGPTEGKNYQFVEWWHRICSQVRLHALKVSFYDVIHAQWPNAKCGNYFDASSDGKPVRTSWYQDLSQINTYIGADWPEAADIAARTRWDSFRNNTILRATPYRWCNFDSMKRTGVDTLSNFRTLDNSGATADCPEMYPLNVGYALDGATSGDVVQGGWRQRNLYVNPANCYPARTDAIAQAASEEYSNLLSDRLAAESIINSNPSVDKPLGNVDRLVPWLWQRTQGVGETAQAFYASERQHRAQLMMLRGKKVKELLWFHGTSDYIGPNPWNTTRNLVYRVFTPRIDRVRRVFDGIVNRPSADVLKLPGQIDDTLRRNRTAANLDGSDYTANFSGYADLSVNGVNCGKRRTGMLVQFGRMERQDADNDIAGRTSPRPVGVEVRVEVQGLSGGQPGNVTGRLFVFNWLSLEPPSDSETVIPRWYSVSTVEGEDPYLLYTPDGKAHLTFRFLASGLDFQFISPGDVLDSMQKAGRLLLWLEQEGPANASLDSKYDVVQAVTINMPPSEDASSPRENLEPIPEPRIRYLASRE